MLEVHVFQVFQTCVRDETTTSQLDILEVHSFQVFQTCVRDEKTISQIEMSEGKALQ
jgi:hypothetical protein